MTTLVVRGVALEDPVDPVMGARIFAAAAPVGDGVRVVLLGAGLGHRLEALRARGIGNVVAFEPDAEVLQRSRALRPQAFTGTPVFADLRELGAHLLTRARSSERTVVMASPAYVAAYPGAQERLVEVVTEAAGLVVLRENTLIERARAIVENALVNLPHLAEAPLATAIGRPLAGTPAFLVAAGPSLDRNAELLPAAARKGAVFAVNTSAGCVAAAGVQADVLVAVENVDVSAAVAKSARAARAVALEIAAHPALFAVDVPQRLAFVSAQPAFAELCAALDSPGLDYGASVATAAFALARAWGADPIVLVGQDLAYTGGQVYARGAAYDGMIARREGDELVLEGRPEKDEEYRRSGLAPQPRRKPRVEVPAWGGGVVDSTHELLMFLRWFEGAAAAAGGPRLVNATEGGARIAGFEERRLADVLAALPDRTDDLAGVLAAARGVGADRVAAIQGQIRESARQLAQAAARVARSAPARLARAHEDVRAAARRAPLADLHASGALQALLLDRGLGPADRARQTFEIIRASADRVNFLLKT